jgi:hypothetical protein
MRRFTAPFCEDSKLKNFEHLNNFVPNDAISALIILKKFSFRSRAATVVTTALVVEVQRPTKKLRQTIKPIHQLSRYTCLAAECAV